MTDCCLLIDVPQHHSSWVEQKVRSKHVQKNSSGRIAGSLLHRPPENLVPRSSLLCLRWSLEERPWWRLVRWPLVTQTFPERKAIAGHRYIEPHTSKYTLEILESYSKLDIRQTKYLSTYIQRIEVSFWFQFQPVELRRSKTVSLFHVAWIIKLHSTLLAILCGVLFHHFQKYNSWLWQGTVFKHLSKYKWNISTGLCQQNFKSFYIEVNQNTRLIDRVTEIHFNNQNTAQRR